MPGLCVLMMVLLVKLDACEEVLLESAGSEDGKRLPQLSSQMPRTYPPS